MSDLQFQGLQLTRLSSLSPSPGVCPNSCPLSWWCHPTISSSVAPYSSCPQSFPALGSFLMSQLFTSGSQSIGASASAPVLPMSIQGWFPLGLTDILAVQGNLKSLLQHHIYMCVYIYIYNQFNSVQSLSRVQLFVTPGISARQASLSITISRSSLTLMSIESVMPSSHLILCRPRTTAND